jgi:transglutaminase-like putative cysteine protease
VSRSPRANGSPEESVAVRLTVLAAVLVAVGAVGVFEEFTGQALLAGAAIAAGYWVSYRRRHARNFWLKVGVALAILFVARDFLTALLANPYDPRIALVRLFLWLQALHSLDVPRRRDLKYSLISSVVLMAVGAAYARDAAFGLWLIPYTATAAVAVVTMQLDSHPQGERVANSRLATAVRASAALLLAVVVGAVLLFVAVPRVEGYRTPGVTVSPWLARQLQFPGRIYNPAYPDAPGQEISDAPPVFNPTGYIGFSTYVDLRLRGILTHDLVMRVRTTRPAFWRGLAFDEYTGAGWRMSDPAVTEFQAVGGRVPLRFTADEPWPAGSETVIQTFYIEAAQPNVIFSAYRASEVYFPSGGIEVDRYAGLRSPVALEEGIIYSVISRAPSPAPAQLRSDDRRVPPHVSERYLQLPRIPDRVVRLAGEITAGLPTAYDKAVAINRFLSRGYTYTLEAPPLPPGADAVDEFLFESRRGACEVFASAMAVLLRAAGVPARLVTGYTTGNHNLLTGFYEVYNSDAHAWVEVYLPRVGWLEFEPTPGFAPPDVFSRDRPGRWLAADAASWLVARARVAWSGLVTGAHRLGALARRGVDPSSGAVAVLALTLVLLRRKRASGTDRPAPAGDVYARMVALLGRRGFTRSSAQTPREYVDALPAPLRPAARTITDSFERWRYAGRFPSATEARSVAEALSMLRRESRRVRPAA